MKPRANLELELEAHGNATLVQRRAAAPLKARQAQAPCDFGLFGDQAQQLDLVDQARATSKGSKS